MTGGYLAAAGAADSDGMEIEDDTVSRAAAAAAATAAEPATPEHKSFSEDEDEDEQKRGERLEECKRAEEKQEDDALACLRPFYLHQWLDVRDEHNKWSANAPRAQGPK